MNQELLELTSKLVSFNTCSSVSDPDADHDTVGIADFISDRLESCGFNVFQYPYSSLKTNKRKVNLVAYKGGTDPFLALSGHMDTVGFNETNWRFNNSNQWRFLPGDGNGGMGGLHSPLEVKKFLCLDKSQNCGEVYSGRGIADMKLFLAVAMIVGARISATRIKRPFALYFSSDEEIGCLGIKRLLGKGLVSAPNFVLIGEPTDLYPVYMHKGYMYLRVVLKDKGQGGHTSDPDSGSSLVTNGLPEVLGALRKMEHILRLIKDNRFEVSFPTHNTGTIHTGVGSAKNKFVKECAIEIEIRPIPGQHSDEIFYALGGFLKSALKGTIKRNPNIEFDVSYVRAPTPPMETERSSRVVTLAEEISGKGAITVPFNTEGGIFNKYGAETDPKTQTVIMGPGSISQAHKDDEYVATEWFDDGVLNRYELFIQKMCC